MSRTVEDELRKLAEEKGRSFDSYMEFWLDGLVQSSVPERYRRLVREVWLRLPEGWDEHAVWEVAADSEEDPDYYAHVVPVEGGDYESTAYEIVIHGPHLDALSDGACRWILAHEFAHIASKLAQGSVEIDREPYTESAPGVHVRYLPKEVHEDAANRIALEWGFNSELQAFLREQAGRASE